MFAIRIEFRSPSTGRVTRICTTEKFSNVRRVTACCLQIDTNKLARGACERALHRVREKIKFQKVVYAQFTLSDCVNLNTPLTRLARGDPTVGGSEWEQHCNV